MNYFAEADTGTLSASTVNTQNLIQMSDAFFSGTWYGQYTYGESYGDDYVGLSTSFEISMTLKNGVLKGTCTDDKEKVAVKKPASIEGFIEGTLISFIKKYACAWVTDISGNIIEFPNRPSHEVHYSGYFENGLFEGEWEIVNSTQIDQYGNIEYNALRGTWSMKHSDD